MCWEGCGEKRMLVQCWWKCKLIQLLWKTVQSFLKKVKTELPYDPPVPVICDNMDVFERALC